ncbi:MAG: amidohydrolase [Dehalococcoidales bacterium]|nr:amidohydrolase [Dehalococcoidales bacterium]
MPDADIILKNANVITMDAALPAAEAVAVSGDRILAVGGKDVLELAANGGTKVIDCQGRTVVPGFNDAHLHLFSLIRKLLDIDLSPAAVRSIADIKEAVRRRAEKTPPGTWLSGTDYNEFYLAGKRCPTRWDLDEAAPDHPVVLTHRSLHACVLNSRALALAGINRETPEPEGARIERDLETGEPNGILVEMLSYIRSEVMPPLSDAELDEAFDLADRHFLSNGITSFQEATYRNDRSRWDIVRRYIDGGRLHSRVSMMAGPETRREFQADGMGTGSGDEWLRLGAVKIMLGESAGQGELTQEELNRLVLDVHQSGFQLAFHAITEDAIESAINALEYVDRQSTVAGRRHRIEHCSECPPRLLERLPKLGVVIVTHPATVYYSGERYLATVDPRQLSWLYRIRSPLESGLVVAAASDAPVSPVNPLAGIYGAVTRRAESGQVILPEEAVSPHQALAMYTVNAAYASFEEDIKGSITPGRLADMVVLSDDPSGVAPEKIKDIGVEMTVIGGEVVWEG